MVGPSLDNGALHVLWLIARNLDAGLGILSRWIRLRHAAPIVLGLTVLQCDRRGWLLNRRAIGHQRLKVLERGSLLSSLLQDFLSLALLELFLL